MADTPHRPTPSGRMMESASHLIITGGSFVAAQSNITSVENRKEKMKALYNTVSLNAILNSGGRADPVRCFPGTREEIIARIETWIEEQNRVHPIFWLSGPAGAGKSAIAQTIAERCLERGVSMINFFFFRSDATHSHARGLVATLLYQIFNLFPDADSLKARIEDTIFNKPLVFSASLEQQFEDLMYHVIYYLRDLCDDCRRVVVIIDGLDECAQENQPTQQKLLRALYAFASSKNSSLKIFIGSRAEPHLIMAFNELPSPVITIFLDAANYRPSDDIRYMVIGQFKSIRKAHHLSWTLNEDWPFPVDIEEIVTKSSGQFIYAATIMRYIASSPESPSHSLERVKGIRPIIRNSPFDELDAIYTYILSCVNDWESAKELLAAHILMGLQETMLEQFTSRTPHRLFVFKALGYAVTGIPSYLSDLTALLHFNRERREIIFYHTSLVDFLLDKVRSNAYYIDLVKFRIKLVPKLFNNHMNDDEVFWHVSFSQFNHIESIDVRLTEALLRPSITGVAGLKTIGHEWVRIFVDKLAHLYLEEEPSIYQRILTIWLTAFRDSGFRFRDDFMEKKAARVWAELINLKVESDPAEAVLTFDTSHLEAEGLPNKGELDQAQAVPSETRLLSSEVPALLAGIEGSSTIRAHIQEAYAAIEDVRHETAVARKALSYAWAEVGRAADAQEAVRVAGRAEAEALRAEVHSVQSELKALRKELASLKDSNESWSTVSGHPTNSSTLFSYHDRTAGDCKNQWIVI